MSHFGKRCVALSCSRLPGRAHFCGGRRGRFGLDTLFVTTAVPPKPIIPLHPGVRRLRRWLITLVVLLVVAAVGGPPVYRRAKIWRARGLAAEAERLLGEKKLPEASAKAQAAIGLAPGEPAAWRAVARVLTNAGSGLALNYWTRLVNQPEATPEDWLAATRLALQMDRLDFADEQLARLLAADPPAKETLELAAQVAWQKKQPEAALEFLHRLMERDPANEGARLLHGQILAGSPDRWDAQEGVRELSKLGQGDSAVALTALQALAQRPNLPAELAGQTADRLAAHPLAQTADRLAALCLRWLQEPARRTELIEQAVARYGKSGPGDLLALGRWLLQQSEAARVLELLDAGQAMTSQELFLVRLDGLAGLGRWAEIKQAVEAEKAPIKPVYAEIFQARAAKELGQLQEANGHWTLALSHAQPILEQNLYLARYAGKMGEHRVAAKAWRQVARTPAWAVRANLAALPELEKDGDTRGLREAVQQLARLVPGDPAPRNDAAYLDLLLGENLKTASATAELLVQEHPEVLAYRTTLALARLRGERVGEALKLYEGLEVPWEKAPARSRAIHAAVLVAAGTAKVPALPDTLTLLPEERALLRHPLTPR